MSSNLIDGIQRREFKLTTFKGRTEPRLWVELVVIWERPGKVIRKIKLRRGLNIIWTPDPADKAGLSANALADYGGKTTFCRLLRYCLGEDTFACEADQDAIRQEIPNGLVGARVRIDGERWTVIRSLNNNEDGLIVRDTTLGNAMLQYAAPAKASAGPMGTAIGCNLSPTITKAVLGGSSKLMPAELHDDKKAWGAALAWATRDQKCGYNDHLLWRHTRCQSGSPVTNMSNYTHAVVVRALMGALSLEESKQDSIHAALLKEERTLKSDMEKLEPSIERLSKELHDALKVRATERSDIKKLRDAAEQSQSGARKRQTKFPSADLSNAVLDRDKADEVLRRLESELAEISIRMEATAESINGMRALLSSGATVPDIDKSILCPVAMMTLGDALQKGCLLTGSPLLECLNSRIENELKQLLGWTTRRSALESEIGLATKQLADAKSIADELANKVSPSKPATVGASKLVDRIRELDSLFQEKEMLAKRLQQCRVERSNARGALRACRKPKTDLVKQFKGLFDSIINELLPGNIVDSTDLVGERLSPKVLGGGESLPEGVETVKVIAFDLAALALSFTAETYLPGFLVHDCPHGTDYGNSIYFRLFALVKKMEESGCRPLFQYLVTTTTKPPEEFCRQPWLRETLFGNPPEERLLKVHFRGRH